MKRAAAGKIENQHLMIEKEENKIQEFVLILLKQDLKKTIKFFRAMNRFFMGEYEV